jgi:hypothetical protein
MSRFRSISFPLALILTAGTAAGQATVKSESLRVYSQRDTRSTVVKTLHRGDTVEIEMSITGEGNLQWCSIHESGQKGRLGHVPCESLERPPAAKQTVPRAPTRTESAVQPGARASGGVREGFWEPTHRQSGGELRWMGYAAILATTFEFSPEQKARVLQFARQSGMGPCIEDTDSYQRRGLQPPDLLSSSPLTQCDWNAQTFREGVFSLVTPEQKAASRVSYENFSREIAGNRLALEGRSSKR